MYITSKHQRRYYQVFNINDNNTEASVTEKTTGTLSVEEQNKQSQLGRNVGTSVFQTPTVFGDASTNGDAGSPAVNPIKLAEQIAPSVNVIKEQGLNTKVKISEQEINGDIKEREASLEELIANTGKVGSDGKIVSVKIGDKLVDPSVLFDKKSFQAIQKDLETSDAVKNDSIYQVLLENFNKGDTADLGEILKVDEEGDYGGKGLSQYYNSQNSILWEDKQTVKDRINKSGIKYSAMGGEESQKIRLKDNIDEEAATYALDKVMQENPNVVKNIFANSGAKVEELTDEQKKGLVYKAISDPKSAEGKEINKKISDLNWDAEAYLRNTNQYSEEKYLQYIEGTKYQNKLDDDLSAQTNKLTGGNKLAGDGANYVGKGLNYLGNLPGNLLNVGSASMSTAVGSGMYLGSFITGDKNLRSQGAIRLAAFEAAITGDTETFNNISKANLKSELRAVSAFSSNLLGQDEATKKRLEKEADQRADAINFTRSTASVLGNEVAWGIASGGTVNALRGASKVGRAISAFDKLQDSSKVAKFILPSAQSFVREGVRTATDKEVAAGFQKGGVQGATNAVGNYARNLVMASGEEVLGAIMSKGTKAVLSQTKLGKSATKQGKLIVDGIDNLAIASGTKEVPLIQQGELRDSLVKAGATDAYVSRAMPAGTFRAANIVRNSLMGGIAEFGGDVFGDVSGAALDNVLASANLSVYRNDIKDKYSKLGINSGLQSGSPELAKYVDTELNKELAKNPDLTSLGSVYDYGMEKLGKPESLGLYLAFGAMDGANAKGKNDYRNAFTDKMHAYLENKGQNFSVARSADGTLSQDINDKVGDIQKQVLAVNPNARIEGLTNKLSRVVSKMTGDGVATSANVSISYSVNNKDIDLFYAGGKKIHSDIFKMNRADQNLEQSPLTVTVKMGLGEYKTLSLGKDGNLVEVNYDPNTLITRLNQGEKFHTNFKLSTFLEDKGLNNSTLFTATKTTNGKTETIELVQNEKGKYIVVSDGGEFKQYQEITKKDIKEYTTKNKSGGTKKLISDFKETVIEELLATTKGLDDNLPDFIKKPITELKKKKKDGKLTALDLTKAYNLLKSIETSASKENNRFVRAGQAELSKTMKDKIGEIDFIEKVAGFQQNLLDANKEELGYILSELNVDKTGKDLSQFAKITQELEGHLKKSGDTESIKILSAVYSQLVSAGVPAPVKPATRDEKGKLQDNNAQSLSILKDYIKVSSLVFDNYKSINEEILKDKEGKKTDKVEEKKQVKEETTKTPVEAKKNQEVVKETPQAKKETIKAKEEKSEIVSDVDKFLSNKTLNPEGGIFHAQIGNTDSFKQKTIVKGNDVVKDIFKNYGINYIVLTEENVKSILGKENKNILAKWKSEGLSTRYKTTSGYKEGVQTIAYLSDSNVAAENLTNDGNRAISLENDGIRIYGNYVSADGLIKYQDKNGKRVKGYNLFDEGFSLQDILDGNLYNKKELKINPDGIFGSIPTETSIESSRVSFINNLRKSITDRINEATKSKLKSVEYKPDIKVENKKPTTEEDNSGKTKEEIKFDEDLDFIRQQPGNSGELLEDYKEISENVINTISDKITKGVQLNDKERIGLDLFGKEIDIKLKEIKETQSTTVEPDVVSEEPVVTEEVIDETKVNENKVESKNKETKSKKAPKVKPEIKETSNFDKQVDLIQEKESIIDNSQSIVSKLEELANEPEVVKTPVKTALREFIDLGKERISGVLGKLNLDKKTDQKYISTTPSKLYDISGIPRVDLGIENTKVKIGDQEYVLKLSTHKFKTKLNEKGDPKGWYLADKEGITVTQENNKDKSYYITKNNTGLEINFLTRNGKDLIKFERNLNNKEKDEFIDSVLKKYPSEDHPDLHKSISEAKYTKGKYAIALDYYLQKNNTPEEYESLIKERQNTIDELEIAGITQDRSGLNNSDKRTKIEKINELINEKVGGFNPRILKVIKEFEGLSDKNRTIEVSNNIAPIIFRDDGKAFYDINETFTTAEVNQGRKDAKAILEKNRNNKAQMKKDIAFAFSKKTLLVFDGAITEPRFNLLGATSNKVPFEIESLQKKYLKLRYSKNKLTKKQTILRDKYNNQLQDYYNLLEKNKNVTAKDFLNQSIEIQQAIFGYTGDLNELKKRAEKAKEELNLLEKKLGIDTDDKSAFKNAIINNEFKDVSKLYDLKLQTLSLEQQYEAMYKNLIRQRSLTGGVTDTDNIKNSTTTRFEFTYEKESDMYDPQVIKDALSQDSFLKQIEKDNPKSIIEEEKQTDEEKELEKQKELDKKLEAEKVDAFFKNNNKIINLEKQYKRLSKKDKAKKEIEDKIIQVQKQIAENYSTKGSKSGSSLKEITVFLGENNFNNTSFKQSGYSFTLEQALKHLLDKQNIKKFTQAYAIQKAHEKEMSKYNNNKLSVEKFLDKYGEIASLQQNDIINYIASNPKIFGYEGFYKDFSVNTSTNQEKDQSAKIEALIKRAFIFQDESRVKKYTRKGSIENPNSEREIISNSIDPKEYDNFNEFRESFLQEVHKKAVTETNPILQNNLFNIYFDGQYNVAINIANSIYNQSKEATQDQDLERFEDGLEDIVDEDGDILTIDEQKKTTKDLQVKNYLDWVKSQFVMDSKQEAQEGKSISLREFSSIYPKQYKLFESSKQEAIPTEQKLTYKDFISDSKFDVYTANYDSVGKQSFFDPITFFDEAIYESPENSSFVTLNKARQNISELSSKVLFYQDEDSGTQKLKILGQEIELDNLTLDTKLKELIFGWEDYLISESIDSDDNIDPLLFKIGLQNVQNTINSFKIEGDKYSIVSFGKKINLGTLDLSKEQKVKAINNSYYLIANSLNSDLSINPTLFEQNIEKFKDGTLEERIIKNSQLSVTGINDAIITAKLNNYADQRANSLEKSLIKKLEYVVANSQGKFGEVRSILDIKSKNISDTLVNSQSIFDAHNQELINRYVYILADLYNKTNQHSKLDSLSKYGTSMLEIQTNTQRSNTGLTKTQQENTTSVEFGEFEAPFNEAEVASIVDSRVYQDLEDKPRESQVQEDDYNIKKEIDTALSEFIEGIYVYKNFIRKNISTTDVSNLEGYTDQIEKIAEQIDEGYLKASKLNDFVLAEKSLREQVKYTDENPILATIVTDISLARLKNKNANELKNVSDTERKYYRYQLANNPEIRDSKDYAKFKSYVYNMLKAIGISNAEVVAQFEGELLSNPNVAGAYVSLQNEILLDPSKADKVTVAHEAGHYFFDRLPQGIKNKLYQEITTIAQTRGLTINGSKLNFSSEASREAIGQSISDTLKIGTNEVLSTETALEEAIMYELQKPIANSINSKGNVSLYTKAKINISKFFSWLRRLVGKDNSFLNNFRDSIILGEASTVRPNELYQKTEQAARETHLHTAAIVGDIDKIDTGALYKGLQTYTSKNILNQPLVTFEIDESLDKVPLVDRIGNNSFIVKYNPKYTDQESEILNQVNTKVLDSVVKNTLKTNQVEFGYQINDTNVQEFTQSILDNTNRATEKGLKKLVNSVLKDKVILDNGNNVLVSGKYNIINSFNLDEIRADLKSNGITTPTIVHHFSNKLFDISTDTKLSNSDKLGLLNFTLSQLSLTDGNSIVLNSAETTNQLSQLILSSFNTLTDAKSSYFKSNNLLKKEKMTDLQAMKAKIEELIISKSILAGGDGAIVFKRSSDSIYNNLQNFLSLEGELNKEKGNLSQQYYQVQEGLILNQKEFSLVQNTENVLFISGQGGNITQDQKDSKTLSDKYGSGFSTLSNAIGSINSVSGLQQFLHTRQSLLETKPPGIGLTEAEERVIQKLNLSMEQNMFSSNQSMYNIINISDLVTSFSNKKGDLTKAGAIGKNIGAHVNFFTQALIQDATRLETIGKTQSSLSSEKVFKYDIQDPLTKDILNKLFFSERKVGNTGSVYDSYQHLENSIQGFESYISTLLTDLGKNRILGLTEFEGEMIESFLVQESGKWVMSPETKEMLAKNKLLVGEFKRKLDELYKTYDEELKAGQGNDKLTIEENGIDREQTKEEFLQALSSSLSKDIAKLYDSDFVNILKGISKDVFVDSKGKDRLSEKSLKNILQTVDDFQRLTKIVRNQIEKVYNSYGQDTDINRETNSPYFATKFVKRENTEEAVKLKLKDDEATITKKQSNLSRELLKAPIDYDLDSFKNQFQNPDNILLQSLQSKTVIYKNNQDPFLYLADSINLYYQRQLEIGKKTFQGIKETDFVEAFTGSQLASLQSYLQRYKANIMKVRNYDQDLEVKGTEEVLKNVANIIQGGLFKNFKLAMIAANLQFLFIGSAVIANISKTTDRLMTPKIALSLIGRLGTTLKDMAFKTNSHRQKVENITDNLVKYVKKQAKDNNYTAQETSQAINYVMNLKSASLAMLDAELSKLAKSSNQLRINQKVWLQSQGKTVSRGSLTLKRFGARLEMITNTIYSDINTTANISLLVNIMEAQVKNLDFSKKESIDSVGAFSEVLKQLEFINSLPDNYYSGLENVISPEMGLFAKTPLRIASAGLINYDLGGSKSLLLAADRQLRNDARKYPDLAKMMKRFGIETIDPSKGSYSKAMAKGFETFRVVSSVGIVSVITGLLVALLKGDDDEREKYLDIIKDLAGRNIGRGMYRVMDIGIFNSGIIMSGYAKNISGTYELIKFGMDQFNNASRVYAKLTKGGENQENVFGVARDTLLLGLSATPFNTLTWLYRISYGLNANLNTEGEKIYRKQEDTAEGLNWMESIIAASFYSNNNYSGYEGQIKNVNSPFDRKPGVKSEFERIIRDITGVRDKKEKTEKKLEDLLDNNNAINRKGETPIEGFIKNIIGAITPKDENNNKYNLKPEQRLPDNFPKNLKDYAEKSIANGTLTREQAIDLANKGVIAEDKLKVVDEYVDLNNRLYIAKQTQDQKEIDKLKDAMKKLEAKDPDYQRKIDEITKMGYQDFAKNFGEKQLEYTYDDKNNKFSVKEKKKQDTAESIDEKARKELFDIDSGRSGSSRGSGSKSAKIGNRFSSKKLKTAKAAKIKKAKLPTLKKVAKAGKISGAKSIRFSRVKSSSGSSGTKSMATRVRTTAIKPIKLKPIRFKAIKLKLPPAPKFKIN